MNQVSIYKQLVTQIIKYQDTIIGPLAIEQANEVSGLSITPDLSTITITGDAKLILTQLVEKYQILFGQASVEACKDAVKELLHTMPKQDIPELLLK
jgi:hypothetical protein